MTANSNRFSTYTSTSVGTGTGSEGKKDDKKDMWSSMLDSVASGKRLPEKNLLVLGTHQHTLCTDRRVRATDKM